MHARNVYHRDPVREEKLHRTVRRSPCLPLVTLPPCLMDCYKVLYPNLDFSRIAFYSGMPSGH